MKNAKLFRTVSSLLGASALLALAGCDIDQTAEGELPSVDVDVSGGQLPEFDVETADIEVDRKPVTVEVPDVDVSMKEKTFNVPDVDIVMPDDNTEIEPEMDSDDNDGADADERR